MISSQPFPLRLTRRVVIQSAAAMALALALIPFSEAVWAIAFPVLRFFSVFERFFEVTEYFVSSVAILAIGAAIWILDPPNRKWLAVFLAAYCLAGLVNNILKNACGRARPRVSVLVNADGGDEEWLAEHVAEHPDTPVRLDGSTRWLLFKQNRPWGLENYKSFPSGHAVSAFAMAAFLIALYPQGRWLWLALAIGCMLSRVYFRMHYFEDTLFAAGEGWLIAHWVFSRPFAVRLAKLAEQRIPRVRVNEPEWARVQPPLAPLTSAASAADEEPGG